MALHQYIPPTSCHPPGALTGLVFGQILQIFQLCLRDEDINSELATFHHRLLDRGAQYIRYFKFGKGSKNEVFWVIRDSENDLPRQKTTLRNSHVI